LKNFDWLRKEGLPNNYDIYQGWWFKRQNEILSSLNFARYEQLSIELKESGPVENDITKLEALTILQSEQLNLVGGISRLHMVNNLKEKKLNFDFKISKWNEQVFINWKPTYVDIKSPLDPEVIRARKEPNQTLED
jgi:hypothetical protein